MAHQILIIEDDHSFIEAMEGILRREGYQTVVCTTYHNLLHQLQPNNISLILMDVYLNEFDGRKIAQMIKSLTNYNSIPIIFTTVLDRKEAAIDDSYEMLTKPFAMRTMIETVRPHLT